MNHYMILVHQATFADKMNWSWCLEVFLGEVLDQILQTLALGWSRNGDLDVDGPCQYFLSCTCD